MPLTIHQTIDRKPTPETPWREADSPQSRLFVAGDTQCVKVAVKDDRPSIESVIILTPPQAMITAAKLVHSALAASAGHPVDLQDPKVIRSLRQLFDDSLDKLVEANGRVDL